MTGASLDVERLDRRLFHPTIAPAPLRLGPSRESQHRQNRERYSEIDFHAEAVPIHVCINAGKNTNARVTCPESRASRFLLCVVRLRYRADCLNLGGGNKSAMQDEPAQVPNVSLAKLFGVFLYIGSTSFGGGAIAYLRDHLVLRQKWLDEDHFLATCEIGQTVR